MSSGHTCCDARGGRLETMKPREATRSLRRPDTRVEGGRRGRRSGQMARLPTKSLSQTQEEMARAFMDRGSAIAWGLFLLLIILILSWGIWSYFHPPFHL